MNYYEYCIIGSGPAGTTAAIYLGRGKKGHESLILIAGNQIGGLLSTTTSIDNFPGFLDVSAEELTSRLEKQARFWCTQFLYDEVQLITIIEGEYKFKLSCISGDIFAKKIILAMGAHHRKLGKGEEIYENKGVYYCATCECVQFREKTVAVVGGGDSAFIEAEVLSKGCKKVYILVRSDKLRANTTLVSRVSSLPNVEILFNSEIEEFIGTERLNAIIVGNKNKKEKNKIELDGIFVAIGHIPNTHLLKNLIDLDSEGYIIVNNKMETSLKGMYAAGDITDKIYRQAVTAAAQGCMAAMNALKSET